MKGNEVVHQPRKKTEMSNNIVNDLLDRTIAGRKEGIINQHQGRKTEMHKLMITNYKPHMNLAPTLAFTYDCSESESNILREGDVMLALSLEMERAKIELTVYNEPLRCVLYIRNGKHIEKIDDNFMSYPHVIVHNVHFVVVKFENMTSLRTIGDDCFRGAKDLGLVIFDDDSSHIEEIGDNFLYNCESLTVLTGRYLSEVTNIGSGFCAYCPNLSHVPGVTKEASLDMPHAECGHFPFFESPLAEPSDFCTLLESRTPYPEYSIAA